MKLPKLPKLPSLKSLHLPSRITMERLLIVSAAALVVVLAVRGGQQTQTAMQQTDFTPDVSTQTIADASPDVEMTATVCWYEDGEGYLVPVTRQIPLQDGVAKATLSLMVKSSENDLAAARMGLRNVIPEGVTFDLDISGGKARVDLSKEALSCQNAEEELLMVQGTAAALCGFDTVQEVTFLFDGQKRSQLTHGTDVSGVFKADGVNLESVETTANLTNASRVQLYFPSADGRLMVPVTRTVFSPADLTTAMLELAKGPEKDSGLEIPLPKDCGLRSVTLIRQDAAHRKSNENYHRELASNKVDQGRNKAHQNHRTGLWHLSTHHQEWDTRKYGDQARHQDPKQRMQTAEKHKSKVNDKVDGGENSHRNDVLSRHPFFLRIHDVPLSIHVVRLC